MAHRPLVPYKTIFMKSTPKSLLSVMAFAAIAFATVAQTPKVMGLIERDSIITVVQPEALRQRLVERQSSQSSVNEQVSGDDSKDSTQPVVTGGYRVQIFADNNARTAKNEARAKAMAIQEQLPHLATYVTYDAPYWRLRVGDFRSETEAESAAAEIKHYFPQFSREVRVVRDRINK